MSRRTPQDQTGGLNSSRRTALQRIGAGAISLPGLTLWTGPPGATAALTDVARISVQESSLLESHATPRSILLRKIVCVNPERVSQQSLGSPPCGAPQVRKWGSPRTPTGFHNFEY